MARKVSSSDALQISSVGLIQGRNPQLIQAERWESDYKFSFSMAKIYQDFLVIYLSGPSPLQMAANSWQ